MKKRIAIIGGVVVAVAVIGGAVWYSQRGRTAGAEEDTVYVTTVATLMGDVSGTQNRYAGVVEPQKTLEVKLESNRTIKELKVEEDQNVKAGDVLFEYDTSTSQDDLAQARLELDQYKNEESSLRSQIATLEKEKAEAGADEQLSYTIQIQSTQIDLNKNEYNQKSKAAEIEKLEKSSTTSEVTSEIDGVIKTINTSLMENGNESESGSGGDSTTFITIVGTGTYRVKGKINEQNMGSIIEGDPVIIRSRVDSELTWSGVMGQVDTSSTSSNDSESAYVDFNSSGSSDEQTSSSSYPFYVNLDSADGLMLGQHVYIEMDYGQSEVKDGIWLDEFYLVDIEEEPYVWASNSKDQLEKRSITLGEYDEELGQYEILEGLTKDDCIAFPAEEYEAGMPTAINDGAQSVGEIPDGDFDSSMDPSMDSSAEPAEDSGEIIDENTEEGPWMDAEEMPMDSGEEPPVDGGEVSELGPAAAGGEAEEGVGPS